MWRLVVEMGMIAGKVEFGRFRVGCLLGRGHVCRE